MWLFCSIYGKYRLETLGLLCYNIGTMITSGLETVIEFNTTRMRVLSSVRCRRWRKAQTARHFSLPIADFEAKAALLLVRHLRAHRIKPHCVRLVLPRPMARWQLGRYSRILNEAGILPECVVIQGEGPGDHAGERVDLIPDDLRSALGFRQEHFVWRRRVLMFLALVFIGCVLLLSLVRDQEARLLNLAQDFSKRKNAAALLVREEAAASLRRDVMRDRRWRQRFGAILGALPASLSLARVRLDSDHALDIMGQAMDAAALAVYAEALKTQGDFQGLVWEVLDMSRPGAITFHISTRGHRLGGVP